MTSGSAQNIGDPANHKIADEVMRIISPVPSMRRARFSRIPRTGQRAVSPAALAAVRETRPRRHSRSSPARGTSGRRRGVGWESRQRAIQAPGSCATGACSSTLAATSAISATAAAPAGRVVVDGRCAVTRQASSHAIPTIAPARINVAPTHVSCHCACVTAAKRRVKMVGAIMPATLDRLATAPCSRPCSRGPT